MTDQPNFEIFLAATPGLEQVVLAEAVAQGFSSAKTAPGGVVLTGGWPDVWRANLCLRTPSRVLARIGGFRAMHLAQLDKRARKFGWDQILSPDLPVKVEVTCKRSRIYHDRAAKQRIETALRESAGLQIDPEAPIRLMTRIEDDLCTFSLDTTGEPLHKRGHKQEIGKAPMRENLAAAFLHQCGYTGSEPVLDPMCGSGTFVLEAAEIATGLAPGRSRSFAFESFASFDPAAWAAMRDAVTPKHTDLRFYGSDRDTGAVHRCGANAARAGVADITQFDHFAISDRPRPDGPPGLVIVNPPYGGRIGNKKLLYALYGALGKTLQDRFKGWRVGIVTSEPGLARATGLTFKPPGPPIPHGGLKIKLYQTSAL